MKLSFSIILYFMLFLSAVQYGVFSFFRLHYPATLLTFWPYILYQHSCYAFPGQAQCLVFHQHKLWWQGRTLYGTSFLRKRLFNFFHWFSSDRVWPACPGWSTQAAQFIGWATLNKKCSQKGRERGGRHDTVVKKEGLVCMGCGTYLYEGV